jgi:hypothetical protein
MSVERHQIDSAWECVALHLRYVLVDDPQGTGGNGHSVEHLGIQDMFFFLAFASLGRRIHEHVNSVNFLGEFVNFLPGSLDKYNTGIILPLYYFCTVKTRTKRNIMP